MTDLTPGAKLRLAVQEEQPLQVVGAINAYHGMLAERTGFRALYISGGGVAAGSLGVPDLGISSLEDVLVDVRRITYATSLPVLVDADTGWGGAFNIARTVRELTRAGAAGCHIEDQVAAKRCGHRPNKAVVSQAEMVDRSRPLWTRAPTTSSSWRAPTHWRWRVWSLPSSGRWPALRPERT
jgi:methylisocitrate lyase